MSPPITPETSSAAVAPGPASGSGSASASSAMTTPPNGIKKASDGTNLSNSSNTSAMLTPGRGSNYAAPNTPIASAKRPRNATSKKKINHAVIHEHESANYASSSANVSATASATSSTCTTAYESSANDATHASNNLAGVLTPVRKMKLESPVLAANANAYASANSYSRMPMSPMHPVKAVTKHDKTDTANDAGTKFRKDSDADSDAALNDSSPSSSTSVLKSIFSPVLNFLNHSNKDIDHVETITDDVDDHANANANADINADSNHASAHPRAIDQAQDRNDTLKSRMHPHTITDKDGDVYMQGYNYDDDDATTPAKTDDHTAIKSNVVNYDHGHYAHTNTHTHATTPSVDTDTDTDTAQDEITSNGHVHPNAHAEADADVSADVSSHDNEQDDEEDEFNPYLFIKYLPPYQNVVPYPQHKICLPPKDPSDPTISLVLDLDETLVHCTVEPIPDADMTFPVFFNGVEYKVHVRTRPFLMDFLEAIHDKFEVIVFTASQEVYASELLNRIDPGEHK